MMRDEVRAGFKLAVADYDARIKAASDAKEAKLAQRHRFEADYRRIRDSVIIPALKQVADELLEPYGWKCNVRSIEQTIEATLEIYRDDLKIVSSGERPFISFKAEAHAPTFSVYTSSQQSQAGPHSARPVAEMSGDFVQQQVLEFFQILASAHR
jgi:hypothetical protein